MTYYRYCAKCGRRMLLGTGCNCERSKAMQRMWYEDRHAVYEIKDGETHKYVAASAWEALRYHLGGELGNDETYSIECIAPEKRLSVTLVDELYSPDYAVDFSADKGFEVTEDAGEHPVLHANAADWAAYYASAGSPILITTTVY